MRKAIFVAVVLTFVAGPAMADISINYGGTLVQPGELTSAVPGAIVDTFDGATPAGWVYGGNRRIVTGPISGEAGVPWYGVPDPTAYLAVPQDDLAGVDPEIATVYFGGLKSTYLGLFWGSMDSYNEIRLYDGLSLVGTVTGDQASLDLIAQGNQGDYRDNAYVNIHSTVAFDNIALVSFGEFGGVSPYAFELDNLAVVPVPGAVLLGMLGLSVVGVKLRKRA